MFCFIKSKNAIGKPLVLAGGAFADKLIFLEAIFKDWNHCSK